MNLTCRIFNKVFQCRQIRLLSTVAEQQVYVQDEPVSSDFRTPESNPAKHTAKDLHKIYTIPPEDVPIVFANGLTAAYRAQNETFCELGLLVRKPALEIISCLQQTDYSRPVNKYVVYGEYGSGKSSTLMHVLHYGYVMNRIIVHDHWVPHWYRLPQEHNQWHLNKDMEDLPIDAATWLLNFRTINTKSLAAADLKTSKRYEWTAREASEAGTPLEELVNHGINRVKYASQVMMVLLDEIKIASTRGKCSTLVVIDGYNKLFSQLTEIRKSYGPGKVEYFHPNQMSITAPLKNMAKYDWCNGAVVVSVDDNADKLKKASYYPRYLLDKEGFEFLDPFVPIKCDRYNDKEYDNMIEYFKDRKWIGTTMTPSGIEELRVISNKNPFAVTEMFKGLW